MDYSLSGDVYHEAGFDALMTGIIFCNIMARLDKDGKFRLEALNEDYHLIIDKNKIPLASIRKSLDLDNDQDMQVLQLPVDIDKFLFVLQGVALQVSSEDIALYFRRKHGLEVRIYRAFNKEYCFVSIYGVCEGQNTLPIESERVNNELLTHLKSG